MMVSTLLLSVVMATSAAAKDEGVDNYLRAEGIYAVKVKKVPRNIHSNTWATAKSKTVQAHVQQSIRLLDKKANAQLQRGATDVTVQALHDGQRIGVRLTWTDATEDRGDDETHHFGDAAAMEVPKTFGRGIRLPYIGMGDAQQKVLVYLMRAFEHGSYGREYIGAGFGSLTRTGTGGQRGDVVYDKKRKTWTALFIRPLNSYGHNMRQGAVPVAFAVWDGSKNERGGNKALTSWKTLILGGYPADAAYLKELSFGYGKGDVGDPAAGKAMVESMCIACHHVGDKKFVPAGMAPDLTGVGNYATYGYLRDSIMNPSQVLVPNPNANRHYQKGGTPDPHGALPNDPTYQWSMGPASKMPPFPLPPEQIAHMLAFLKPPAHKPADDGKESK